MATLLYFHAEPLLGNEMRLYSLCARLLLSALCGAVLMTSGAEAGNLRTLYTFTGKADGGAPNGVIRDAQGNLFGLAATGGANTAGVLFKLPAHGKESIVYSFAGSESPSGVLALDAAGNFYGVTVSGGDQSSGSVFKISPDGTKTTLHSFTGNDDGGSPRGGVVLDAAGNLYGTATTGTLFKIDSEGTFSVLHAFTGKNDGGDPESAPTIDSQGNIFGTAIAGGTHQRGVVYELVASGKYRVLHSFTDGEDGGEPGAPVTVDSNGNVYGTATQGGAHGFGTAFEIGAGGKFRVLHAFADNTHDGIYPQCNLVQDAAGHLFGETSQGGEQLAGMVFELSRRGRFTILHSFIGKDGFDPYGNLTSDGQGNLYGTTYYGGQFDAGTVFRVKE